MQHLLRWGCIAILPSKMSIATRRSAISSLPISLPTDFSPLCLMCPFYPYLCLTELQPFQAFEAVRAWARKVCPSGRQTRSSGRPDHTRCTGIPRRTSGTRRARHGLGQRIPIDVELGAEASNLSHVPLRHSARLVQSCSIIVEFLHLCQSKLVFNELSWHQMTRTAELPNKNIQTELPGHPLVEPPGQSPAVASSPMYTTENFNFQCILV